jgi:septal ring factor EnvC (AmiA/AmiB activator)
MDATDLVNLNTMIPIGSIIAVGALVVTLQKIAKNFKKDQKEHAADILNAAKEADLLIKTQLEDKIKALKVELDNLGQSVEKDLEFTKANHNSEIKNLGEKIEALRQQLHEQHSSLVNLLSKLIDNK